MKTSVPDKFKMRKCISTSLKTTAVGSIAIFEENFGHLWGEGVPEDQLTEEQKLYKERWQETRSQIFDRCRQSEEIALSTLDKFSIKKKTYYKKGFKNG